MLSRTAIRVSRFTQRCYFGAFNYSSADIHAILLKFYFFKNLKFSLVLLLYCPLISISVYKANMTECRMKRYQHEQGTI